MRMCNSGAQGGARFQRDKRSIARLELSNPRKVEVDRSVADFMAMATQLRNAMEELAKEKLPGPT